MRWTAIGVGLREEGLQLVVEGRRYDRRLSATTAANHNTTQHQRPADITLRAGHLVVKKKKLVKFFSP